LFSQPFYNSHSILGLTSKRQAKPSGSLIEMLHGVETSIFFLGAAQPDKSNMIAKYFMMF